MKRMLMVGRLGPWSKQVVTFRTWTLELPRHGATYRTTLQDSGRPMRKEASDA